MRRRGTTPLRGVLAFEMKAHASAILLALTTALVVAPDAKAGTYVVRQCHAPPGENRSHEAATIPAGPYAIAGGAAACTNVGNSYALGVAPAADALHSQSGRLRFSAPTGTELVRVEVDALLRREQGHSARLRMTGAAGGNPTVFAQGESDPTTFSHYTWPQGSGFGSPRQRFEAGLECINPGGSCSMAGNGDKAKARIRNVRMTLRDTVAPWVTLGSELVDGGWIQGERRLKIESSDVGGGVRSVGAELNGEAIAVAAGRCSNVPATSQASAMAPCDQALAAIRVLDTSKPPFRDGENRVRACANDYGTPANQTCTSRTVLVDNTPPHLVFPKSQIAADPELIEVLASDPTSGLDALTAAVEFRPAGGTEWNRLATRVEGDRLRARVSSDAHPPGDYQFRASVRDLAGNESVTSLRADGQPMEVTFPLKDDVEINASLGNGDDDQTVAYRREGEISGRLLDDSGTPVRNQEVDVVETFDEGSLIDRRQRTVQTDAGGRFRSTLPGGPSRDVLVTYGGSRRYRAARYVGLDFNVRGAAKMKVSKRRVRAGRSVSFKGRVKRYFARIPRGGKLVEVQVKSGRRWTTLREAVGTDERGRIKLRHRFRGFYTQPVTFTFRLKATRENGWPYRGAAVSRQQRVTVVPKP